jgi:hypothetical protein
MSPPSLSTIPPEILIIICDELPLSSLSCLRATNHTFCDLLTPRYVTSIYESCKKTGMSPLYHACLRLNLPFANLLIRYGANVSVGIFSRPTNIRYKETPLHVISKSKYDMNAALAIARALLQAGAKVNKRSQFLGKTPLHEAVLFKSAPMVQLLLAWGAKHSARDECGRTPLVVCVIGRGNAHAPYGDSLEIAKLLLEAGAKVNRKIFSP